MRTSRHRTASGRPRAVRLAALLLLSGPFFAAALPPLAMAQSAPAERTDADPHAAYIAEASQRFRMPERWIRAVMQVESAGRVRAVSSAGAMGLMQIMPGTWTGLRVRHRLGRDPFDPRDNILGGTAYLREMHDRFGSPGFLAAYNAGPGRYQQHLARGRPLPRETRLYMARLMPMIDLEPLDRIENVAAAEPDWREAPLFVERGGRASNANSVQIERHSTGGSPIHPTQDDGAQTGQPDGLFVAQAHDERTP